MGEGCPTQMFWEETVRGYSPVWCVPEWLQGGASKHMGEERGDVGNGLNRGRNGSTGHLQSSAGQTASLL